MINYHSISVYIIITAFLVGCSEPMSRFKEDEQTNNNHLQIELYIQDISSKNTSSTDTLAILAVNKDKSELKYNNSKQGKYTTKGEAITPIQLEDEQALIYSCHPYSNINIENETPYIYLPIASLPMSFDIHTATTNFATSAHDYQYGVEYKNNSFRTIVPTVSATSTKATLGMKHAFARIKFTITAPQAFNANNGALHWLRFQRTAYTLTESSTLNILNGKIEHTEKVYEGYNFYFHNLSMKHIPTVTWQFFALPAKAISVCRMDLVIDGQIIESGKLDDVPWQAGFHYDYSIELTDNGLEIATIKIQEWKDGQTSECTIIK
ncbi:MAG: fimbrillin family protein [Marinifilaceae bacterium]